MATTIKMIAEMAGVSPGTVDRALYNRGRVNPEVKKKILDIATQLNYKPNAVAKGLAAINKKYKIAVILHTQINTFQREIIEGVEEAENEIKDNGVTVEIMEGSHFSADYQIGLLEKALKEKVNAIAVNPIQDQRIKDKLNQIASSGIRVYLLSNHLDDVNYCAYYGCNYKAMGAITSGLIRITASTSDRLLIFSASFSMRGHKDRIEGIKEGLKDYGDSFISGVYELPDDDIETYKITRKAIAEHPEVSIIVAPGAVSSKGMITALKDEGIYGKVKLIIFDLSTISKEGFMQNKIIASIEHSPRLQGYNAIKGIYSDLLYGNQPEKINHYVPTKIVLKENLIYG